MGAGAPPPCCCGVGDMGAMGGGGGGFADNTVAAALGEAGAEQEPAVRSEACGGTAKVLWRSREGAPAAACGASGAHVRGRDVGATLPLASGRSTGCSAGRAGGGVSAAAAAPDGWAAL